MTERAPLPAVQFFQHDFIPAFAAFMPNQTLKAEGKAFCVVNLGALLWTVEEREVPASELPYVLAESMMHEIIHALEQWAGVEFSEERVEQLLADYAAKHQSMAPGEMEAIESEYGAEVAVEIGDPADMLVALGVAHFEGGGATLSHEEVGMLLQMLGETTEGEAK